jgi:hypothetical protein
VQDIVNWIQCDSCRNWFHTICVGVKDNALPTWVNLLGLQTLIFMYFVIVYEKQLLYAVL